MYFIFLIFRLKYKYKTVYLYRAHLIAVVTLRRVPSKAMFIFGGNWVWFLRLRVPMRNLNLVDEFRKTA